MRNKNETGIKLHHRRKIRTKNFRKFATFAIVLFAILSFRSAQASSANLNCDLETSADWQKFMQNISRSDSWVETCEDSTCDKNFVRFVIEHVQKRLEACREVIESQPKVKACTAHLRQFLPTWIRQHDATSYGFDVDNHAYLTDQESAERPQGMMQIPAAIIRALPDQARVQEVARSNGWRYLTHDSALGGVRTFIYIPDPQGRFDQWMILNLKSSHQKEIGSQMPVSLLAVQKKTANGDKLDKVQLHFRDYAMTSLARTTDIGFKELEGRYRLSVNESGNGKCFSCHVSGMRQLIARQTAVLEAEPVKGERVNPAAAPQGFAMARLNELNQIMRQYGEVDWNRKINPQNHGPLLGQEQSCTSCHDGHSRGALSIFTSPTQLRQKVLVELSMPPSPFALRDLSRFEFRNPPLSSIEESHLAWISHQNRQSLKDLLDSRAEVLRRWILQTKCVNDPKPNLLETTHEKSLVHTMGVRADSLENLRRSL